MLLISATLKDNRVKSCSDYEIREHSPDLVLLAADQVYLGDEGRLELKFWVDVRRVLVALQQLTVLVERVWNFQVYNVRVLCLMQEQ